MKDKVYFEEKFNELNELIQKFMNDKEILAYDKKGAAVSLAILLIQCIAENPEEACMMFNHAKETYMENHESLKEIKAEIKKKDLDGN